MIGFVNSPRETPGKSITNLGGSMRIKDVYFNEVPASSRICVLAGNSTMSIFLSTGTSGVCTFPVGSAALTCSPTDGQTTKSKTISTVQTALLKLIIFIYSLLFGTESQYSHFSFLSYIESQHSVIFGAMIMSCINQIVTDQYTAIHGDCIEALLDIPDHCIGYSIF